MQTKGMLCNRCVEGRVWLTEEQIETGNTTKKGKWIICPCCKGLYRVCRTCASKELEKQGA